MNLNADNNDGKVDTAPRLETQKEGYIMSQTNNFTVMTTQHTPGTWSRNIRANGKYPVVFAGRNQHVATVCQQEDGAQVEANIDLIAAAPDMLAALIGLIGGQDSSLDNAREAIARAAIAKATGDQS